MEPRNYESGASAAPPAEPGSPSNGYPTSGDPGTGTPATQPGAFWFYKVGESLRNVINSAGLSPSDSDLTLFQQAILKLISASNHVVRLEDVTFAPGVADGDAVYWDNGNSRYDKAIADGTDKQNIVGFADVTNSIIEAFGRSALFSGLTAGVRYYLSGSTAGAITATAPSLRVVVGLAKSAGTLFVDIDPALQQSLGEDQAWQDMSASRAINTVYTNTTGRSIEASVSIRLQPSESAAFEINGAEVQKQNVGINTTLRTDWNITIPDGATYEVTTIDTPNLEIWSELR